MRWRLALIVSVGLNLAFASAFFLGSQERRDYRPGRPAIQSQTNAQLIRTNVVVRRQNFTWNEVESDDFRTYIAKLRAIGCPESTIRDIIVAEVNGLFDRKRAEVMVPEQPWWRVDPSQVAASVIAPQLTALEAERRALLTELLGPNWESPSNADAVALNLRFDGPVLSSLPVRTKAAIRDIETRAARRQEDYIHAQQRNGRAADPAELERMRQTVRSELAQLLTAPQLEEYLLRYSQTAQSLRAELQGIEITADDFRAIFRARDSLDQQIRLASGNDPSTNVRRIDLERQREAAMRQALGEERFQLLRYAQDPLFRQAQTSIEQIGAPPETVMAVYQINQATQAETQRIRNDASMTLEQRATALAQMLSQKEESLRRLLGPAAYERYRQQAQQ